MDIKVLLSLPRDESTLAVARHLAKHALDELGVVEQCVADIELALTEACANVVHHARGDDEYEVHVEITEDDCQIRVVDTGHGFDHEELGRVDAATSDERGRGIQLMRALVDNINFASRPETGMVVHLVKDLEFDDDRRPRFSRSR